MPTYNYKCKACENTFSIKATVKEKGEGLEPSCPKCESENTFQIFNSVGIIGSSGSGNAGCSTCPPGANCCG